MTFENANLNYGKPCVQFFASNKAMITSLSILLNEKFDKLIAREVEKKEDKGEKDVSG
jgi:hypothetical protein